MLQLKNKINCQSCGRTDGLLHTREWISVRSTIEKPFFRVRYSDPDELNLTLCTECYSHEALKGTGSRWKRICILLAVMTMSGFIGIGFIKVHTIMQVILLVPFVLLWIWALLAYQKNVLRLKNKNFLPKDEKYFSAYAMANCTQKGKDDLITKDAWYKYVGKRLISRPKKVNQLDQANGVVQFSPDTILSQTSWFEAEALMILLSIYTENPDDFTHTNGDLAKRAKVREIGEALNQQGGKKLMLSVYTEFERLTSVFGSPSNLERVWDGIGEWIADMEKLKNNKVEADKIT